VAHLKRDFDCRSIYVPGVKPQPAYRIRCSRCPAEDSVSANGPASLPSVAIARKFEAKGWTVSERSAGHDVCPKCVDEEKKLKREQSVKHEKSVAAVVVPPTAPKAEPPPQMTREERRIIFEKLNEVYIDEKTGYAPEWGDGRVAEDLGVAVAWVRMMREENFGPAADNEEIRGLVKQAKACSDEVKKHADTLEHLKEQIRKLDAAAPALTMQSNRIDGHLARIAKQMGIA
jgi:hypothetical protein